MSVTPRIANPDEAAVGKPVFEIFPVESPTSRV